MANVTIKNKRRQRVDIAIVNDSGKLETKSLEPNGTYGPVAEEKVGEYTHRLAKSGHIRIRAVN